jgi:hypothetical protein
MEQLPSWHDGATKAAITDFVAQVSEEGGPDYVEPFDYTAGAEQALATASRQDWTVVSMKNDWNTVFTDAT